MKSELQILSQQIPWTVTDEQAEKIQRYVDLMLKWNRAFNLTAITKPDEILTKHLLDSISIAPFIQGQSILDVGTGAGFPGVILSILLPQTNWVLLDSSQKKIRFLNQVKAELALSNIEPVAARVESYQKPGGFDMILARAFSSLADLVNLTARLCHPSTRYLAMKGQNPREEILALGLPDSAISLEKITVPGLDAERHVVLITPK